MKHYWCNIDNISAEPPRCWPPLHWSSGFRTGPGQSWVPQESKSHRWSQIFDRWWSSRAPWISPPPPRPREEESWDVCSRPLSVYCTCWWWLFCGLHLGNGVRRARHFTLVMCLYLFHSWLWGRRGRFRQLWWCCRSHTGSRGHSGNQSPQTQNRRSSLHVLLHLMLRHQTKNKWWILFLIFSLFTWGIEESLPVLDKRIKRRW